MGSAVWDGSKWLLRPGLGSDCAFVSSASTSSQRFEEAHFTFALTPQQVQQILTSRYISLWGLSPGLCLSSLFYFVSHSFARLLSVPWTSFSLSISTL